MKLRLASVCLGVLLTSAGPALTQAATAADTEGAGTTAAATCTAGSYATTLVNGDQADVYYPEPAPAGGSPVVAFLQGGNADKSLYSGYSRELACAGYVVVVPNHYLGSQLISSENVVNAVLATMKQADAGQTPVAGAVDTRVLGVAGHSVGGAAGLFAIDDAVCSFPFCLGFNRRPAELKAVAAYGTSTVDPFSRQLIDVDSTGVPVALIHGTNDQRADIGNSRATYGILETPKAFVTIDGLNHWGIADVNNPPPSDRTLDPGVQTRAREWGIAKTAKATRLWFDAYLKGDPGALHQLRGDINDASFTVDLQE